MNPTVLEVKTAVVHTWDGEAHEVHGGAYLSPEGYLTSSAEVEKLRRQAEGTAVSLILGAALVGLAAGFWLGRRSGGDED